MAACLHGMAIRFFDLLTHGHGLIEWNLAILGPCQLGQLGSWQWTVERGGVHHLHGLHTPLLALLLRDTRRPLRPSGSQQQPGQIKIRASCNA